MELEIIKNILFIDYKNLYFEKQIYDEKYGKICNVYSLDIINCGNKWIYNKEIIYVTHNSKYKYIYKTPNYIYLYSNIKKFVNNKLTNYIFLYRDYNGYRKSKIYENNEFNKTYNNRYKLTGYLNNILICKNYYNNWISFNIKYNGLKIYLLKSYKGNYKNLKLNKKISNYKLCL